MKLIKFEIVVPGHDETSAIAIACREIRRLEKTRRHNNGTPITIVVVGYNKCYDVIEPFYSVLNRVNQELKNDNT